MNSPAIDDLGQHDVTQLEFLSSRKPIQTFAELPLLVEIADPPKRSTPNQHCAENVAGHRFGGTNPFSTFLALHIGTDKVLDASEHHIDGIVGSQDFKLSLKFIWSPQIIRRAKTQKITARQFEAAVQSAR